MPKGGKRLRNLKANLDKSKFFSIEEASKEIKSLANAKFDETIEAHYRLGIDPRKSDQNVRGTVALPHGTGKSIRLVAITKGDKAAEAEAAGADFVGAEDLIAKIAEGWLDFDAVVASPDMMAQVGGKLGRILGPRGMLPNPKSGTVGPNIGEMVSALKAGRIEFRSDKTGVVHAPIGKASFEAASLADNLSSLISAVEAAKPESSKGLFLRSLHLSSTMGPSLRVSV